MYHCTMSMQYNKILCWTVCACFKQRCSQFNASIANNVSIINWKKNNKMFIHLFPCVHLFVTSNEVIGETWNRCASNSSVGGVSWWRCQRKGRGCESETTRSVGSRVQVSWRTCAAAGCSQVLIVLLRCVKAWRGLCVCARALRCRCRPPNPLPAEVSLVKKKENSVSCQVKEEGGRCCSCAMLWVWAREPRGTELPSWWVLERKLSSLPFLLLLSLF